jgi:hypothetical protein
MILVDTSVVIDYVRTTDAKLGSLFRSLPVALCGVTRAEALHGSRNPANQQNLLTTLNTFQPVTIPDSVWDAVGDNLAALRAGGLTIPFADAVIASVAIANDIEQWTRDQHFTQVQRILPCD